MFQWFQKLTKQKIILIIFVAIALLAGVFMAAQPAAAAALPSLVPECARDSAKYPGGCNVCDAIEVGINITKIMLGTLGSAALLVFVYGGVLMATSRGHSDQVQKGKDALINAVKGVIIVLGSWVVINYGLAIILDQSDFSKVTLSGKPWYQTSCKQGESCGIGYAFDTSGKCVEKCQAVYPTGYSCQDTSTRTGGTAGCGTDLCPGADSIQCCPVP